MTVLAAQHLHKSFGPQVVLDDASLSVDRGEKVGLIGANGTGKSTLAKILAGVETPDGGTVAVRRGARVRYLAQEPELEADKTARQVVEAALTEEQGPHEAEAMLDRLGVTDIDRPCGARSGGERRRIALAELLVARPDVAILDEPTNHLDADTAEWLEEHLAKDFRGAVVLVTHDRYFLDAIVGRIVELERGRLTAYAGRYGDYLEKKAELMAHEERVEQNRQNFLRREREWLRRGPKARGTKQKARIQRALAIEGEAPATSGRPGEVTLLAAESARQGKTIVELKGVAVAPPVEDAQNERGALNRPFDLYMTASDRIGIVGPNGVGKTTLLRAVLAAAEEARTGARPAGAPRVVAGEIVVGRNTKVAYLDQARAQLDDGATIFDAVRGPGGGTMVTLGKETMDLRSYLELFLFDASKQRQKVGALSGGERARVALAKVLREGANLLVLDEPTNDLDLPTLGALEALLDSWAGSVLVVTHDRAFLDRVATHILAFEADPGGGPANVEVHAGGYEDYAAHKREARASAASTERPAPPPEAKAKAKPKGGLTYAERLELEKIVDVIEAAEQQVSELEAKLADPTLYATRGHEVAGLQAELAAARAEAERLVARWEELEQKKGA